MAHLRDQIVEDGLVRRSRVPQNFMAGVGFGSFAYLGREVMPEAVASPGNLYLSVEVGEACQLKCRHCIYHREKSPSPSPSDVAFQGVASAFRDGLRPQWVSFSGKEPTLFPSRLLEFAELARETRALTILMTNGLLLEGDLLERLSPVIDYFDISVDGTESAHDWMRGAGTFRRTWANVRTVHDRYSNHVALIATAVRAALSDGSPQHEDLLALARRIESEFPGSSQVSLTVSLYFGPPSDPLRLGAEEITALVRGLAEREVLSFVLFTANYAHLWPAVSRELGVDSVEPVYDRATGFPIVPLGRTRIVPFNLTQNDQLGLRISNDADVFLSCNHLTLGDEGMRWRLGDLGTRTLGQIVEDVTSGRNTVFRAMTMGPPECEACEHLVRCGGGDPLSGLLFDQKPVDPYCDLIGRSRRVV
jgi:sulfatase maturation enzyme AslB (radical SAM superfamily)